MTLGNESALMKLVVYGTRCKEIPIEQCRQGDKAPRMLPEPRDEEICLKDYGDSWSLLSSFIGKNHLHRKFWLPSTSRNMTNTKTSKRRAMNILKYHLPNRNGTWRTVQPTLEYGKMIFCGDVLNELFKLNKIYISSWWSDLSRPIQSWHEDRVWKWTFG